MKNVLLLLCAMFLLAAPAGATVIYDGGYATGIDDLMIAGMEYDIDFVSGTYDAVFGGSLPYFLGNETDADAAADAIRDALNAEASVPIISAADSGEILLVPYYENTGWFRAKQTGHSPVTNSWQRYGDLVSIPTDTDYSDSNYSYLLATFTPVPEPSTILLIGTGLVGLLGFRKKFKK